MSKQMSQKRMAGFGLDNYSIWTVNMGQSLGEMTHSLEFSLEWCQVLASENSRHLYAHALELSIS